MQPDLSEKEQKFMHDLLRWDESERSFQWVIANLCLGLGGVIFAVSAIITLHSMTDRVGQWVMVPGSLLAILFFVVYIMEDHRIKDRRTAASVLRKLHGGPQT